MLASTLSRYRNECKVFVYARKDQRKNITSPYIYRPVWAAWSFPFQILKESIKSGIDLVHIQFEFMTFGPIASSVLVIPLLLLLRISGIKTVVTLHGPIMGSGEREDLLDSLLPSRAGVPKSLVKPFVLVFYRIVALLSSAIIVHAEVFRRSLIHSGIKKCAVIPHGVQIGPLDEMQDPPSAPDKPHEVLFFGFISPRKGLDTLIKAVKEVNSAGTACRLTIAGKESTYYPDYGGRLEAFSQRTCPDTMVRFVGWVADENLPHLFASADLIALPYEYSISASGPLALALQFGKAVVCTDTQYFRGVLGMEYRSFLVRPRSPSGLAKTMQSVLESTTVRAKLEATSKSIANRDSWGVAGRQTLELYLKVLHCRKDSVVQLLSGLNLGS